METKRFSLQELAERADVAPRTIRYYTTQRLLPPPLARGRYAAYSVAHLDRLRLIEKLKRAYLPLSAIREQLQSLTDTQVAALAAGDTATPSAVRVKAVETGGDAATYVAQILAVTGQATAPEGSGQAPRKRALLMSPALQPESRESVSDREEEVWRRIYITAGVELHVREPIPKAMRSALEGILTEARKRLEEAE